MAHHQENDDERIAEAWLKQQGYADIERPRRDPPDFVVDGKYAVEVRRMNLLVEMDGKIKGEEELQEPLFKAVKRVLDSFGPPVDGSGFYVHGDYDYSRLSLPRTKVLALEIKEALQPLRDEVLKPDPILSLAPRGPLELECGICLHLRPGHPQSSMFSLQHVSDGKGWRLSKEAGKSLRYCIEEKCRKIANSIEEERREFAKRKERCPDREWWLLLVDRVLFRYQDDAESLSREVQVPKPVSRVIVISPEDLEWFYELTGPGGAESSQDGDSFPASASTRRSR